MIDLKVTSPVHNIQGMTKNSWGGGELLLLVVGERRPSIRKYPLSSPPSHFSQRICSDALVCIIALVDTPRGMHSDALWCILSTQSQIKLCVWYLRGSALLNTFYSLVSKNLIHWFPLQIMLWNWFILYTTLDCLAPLLYFVPLYTLTPLSILYFVPRHPPQMSTVPWSVLRDYYYYLQQATLQYIFSLCNNVYKYIYIHIYTYIFIYIHMYILEVRGPPGPDF